MLHGETHSHSSSSGSVTRCFSLRLLLRGEYCSLRRLHTASSSEAAHHTPSNRLRLAELQSCTRRIDVHPPPALLKTYVLLKAHSNPLLCMVWESPAPLSRSNPSLSAWSSRAAMSDMLALPARRQQTALYRSSEELWQSTLVHVIRITFEMVSAKVRESKYLASDSSHCSAS